MAIAILATSGTAPAHAEHDRLIRTVCPMTDRMGVDDAVRLSAHRPARDAIDAQYLGLLASTEPNRKLFVPRFTAYARSGHQVGMKGTWQSPVGTRLQLDHLDAYGVDDPAVAGSEPVTTLTLSQPLLKGAGVRVAASAFRRAGRERTSAELARQIRLADDAMMVANGFAQAITAQRQVAIAQEAVKLAEDFESAMTAFVEAGRRAPADARQSKFFLSQQVANLNSAKATYDTALLTLAPLLGCAVAAQVQLEMPAPLPDDGSELGYAHEDLPELQLQRLALINAHDALAIARNGLLPELLVDLSVVRSPGGLGVGGDPDRSVTDRRIGFTLEIPLNDYAAKSTYRQAQHQLVQSESELEQVEAESDTRMHIAQLGLDNARRQLGLAEEQLRYAEQVLQDETVKLKSGRTSLLEWQSAASSRSSSQAAVDQATLDTYLAQLSLWRARGQLLQKLEAARVQ